MTLTLDTHRMIKRLAQAGFSEPQAESVVDAVREARDFDIATLATKADLAAGLADLRGEIEAQGRRIDAQGEALGRQIEAQGQDLRAEIAALRAETRADIAALRGAELRAEIRAETASLKTAIADSKSEMLKWIFGLLVAQGGAIVWLIRLLPGH